MGEYPHDGSEDEKWAYVQKKIDAIEKYKEDHPNYPKEIREACAVETRQRYEEYLKEQKKKQKKKVEPKNQKNLFLRIEESKQEKPSAQNRALDSS